MCKVLARFIVLVPFLVSAACSNSAGPSPEAPGPTPDVVEGIAVTGRPVFSVQYHPEASPGPKDSHYLFERFVSLIETHKGIENHKGTEQHKAHAAPNA
jgi:hypothetical protein